MDGFLLSLYAAAGGFTTSNRLSPGRRSQDFDPCSLCGERRTRGGKGIIKDTFQFTLSLRRATVLLSSPPVMWQRFQSTLSLRRATVGGCRYFCIIKNFNPRSPCGERLGDILAGALIRPFQSTLSSRRATAGLLTPCLWISDFNPRSPHGERPASELNPITVTVFQSTLSSRRATIHNAYPPSKLQISIHALLTESDLPPPGKLRYLNLFQSTLSSRRATAGTWSVA